MAYLLLLGRDERVFPIRKGPLSIGRGADQDVVLLDSQQSVSRAHARVEVLDGRLFVVDLGSRNSTLLDGTAIQPFVRHPLAIGSMLEIGYHRLQVIDQSPAQTVDARILSETRPVNRLFAEQGTSDLPEQEKDRSRIRQLYYLSRELSNYTELSALVEKLGQALQAVFSPERIYLGLLDVDGTSWQLEQSWLKRGTEQGAFRLPVSLIERVRLEARGTLCIFPLSDPANGSRSTLCAPLLDGSRTFGVILMDDAERAFLAEDLEFLSFVGLFVGRTLADAQERDRLKRRMASLERPSNLWLGESTAMLELRRRVPLVAETRGPVLILGETGTGKSSLAREIHRLSLRHDGPFIKVNCAAIPETLLEAELFGYAARSGIANADPRGRPGRIEQADGGTLFLDEIGDMPIAQQAKLLTVLEDQEVYRLGAARPVAVRFNLVAATSRPLELDIQQKLFREDLFHRLSRIVLRMPPLAERTEDIPALARLLLERLKQDIPRRVRGFSPEVITCLKAWKWPGNVRELENAIAHALIECVDQDLILVSHLPSRLRLLTANDADGVKVRLTRDSLQLTEEERARRTALLEAIRETGSLTRAARKLGMSKQWAIELARRLGVKVVQRGGGSIVEKLTDLDGNTLNEKLPDSTGAEAVAKDSGQESAKESAKESAGEAAPSRAAKSGSKSGGGTKAGKEGAKESKAEPDEEG